MIIIIKDFNSDLLNIKKNYGKTLKDSEYVKINSVNPLHLIIVYFM